MLSPSSLTKAETKITQICHRYPLSLAYIFGSYARRAADAESDLDIAVLDVGLSPRKRHQLRLELIREVAHALEVDVSFIDVVMLVDAPLLLRLNVIRGGRCIFTPHRKTQTSFEQAIRRDYETHRDYIK
jgi:predicted nucleotidyltransferase